MIWGQFHPLSQQKSVIKKIIGGYIFLFTIFTKKLFILGTNYQYTHSFIAKNCMTIEDWPTSFQIVGIYRKSFKIFTYQWKLHISVREKYGKSLFFQIVELFKCYKI